MLLHSMYCLLASMPLLFLSPAQPAAAAAAAAKSPALASYFAVGRPLASACLSFNALSFFGFAVAEAALIWREVGLLEICDEDRASPFAGLAAQLAAFPRLGARVDALNSRAARACAAQFIVLTVNWALCCAVALSGKGGAEYRTPMLLLAMMLPAASRLGRAWALCEECAARRMALPLWGEGLLSLNVLDEEAARTGVEEEGAEGAKRMARLASLL